MCEAHRSSSGRCGKFIFISRVKHLITYGCCDFIEQRRFESKKMSESNLTEGSRIITKNLIEHRQRSVHDILEEFPIPGRLRRDA